MSSSFQRVVRTCVCCAPARGRRTTSSQHSRRRRLLMADPDSPGSKGATGDDIFSKILAAPGPGDLDDFLRSLDRLNPGLPSRVNADPQNVERGLAQLVLTLIELLRQIMERQAVRRMEG